MVLKILCPYSFVFSTLQNSLLPHTHILSTLFWSKITYLSHTVFIWSDCHIYTQLDDGWNTNGCRMATVV